MRAAHLLLTCLRMLMVQQVVGNYIYPQHVFVVAKNRTERPNNDKFIYEIVHPESEMDSPFATFCVNHKNALFFGIIGGIVLIVLAVILCSRVRQECRTMKNNRKAKKEYRVQQFFSDPFNLHGVYASLAPTPLVVPQPLAPLALEENIEDLVSILEEEDLDLMI